MTGCCKSSLTGPGESETKLVSLGTAASITVGIAIITMVVLHILTMQVQYEPSTSLLKNATNPFFQFIYGALTIAELLTILVFIGLRRLTLTTHASHTVLATVAGVVSSVMFALSSIVYATTMPGLASAFNSAGDSDLQRAILFQASAFDNLALGIIAVATLVFFVSLLMWSRAMDRRFGKYSLFTLALGIYSAATLLPFWAGSILPWLTLLTLEAVWLVALGLKIVVLTAQK
jgi:hypothetical protein